MSQIGEPQRVIISEPLWEPLPSREVEPLPVEQPEEVPDGVPVRQ